MPEQLLPKCHFALLFIYYFILLYLFDYLLRRASNKETIYLALCCDRSLVFLVAVGVQGCVEFARAQATSDLSHPLTPGPNPPPLRSEPRARPCAHPGRRSGAERCRTGWLGVNVTRSRVRGAEP